MKNINNIIFDLGGVLVDWNPNYMYKKLITDENQRKWFLETVCTSDWNEEQDGGRLISEANALLINSFPEYKEWILAYYERWEEMLNGPIHGTVEVFKELKEKRGSREFEEWFLNYSPSPKNEINAKDLNVLKISSRSRALNML